MIICPNCHHQEITGALFCSECGTQIVLTKHVKTQFLGKKPISTEPLLPDSKPLGGNNLHNSRSEFAVSLYLVDSGQLLHLVGRTEYSLGRLTEGQPIIPDVDFSPYDAYTQGVSRLHAAMKVVGSKLMITDLGSSNGTKINGQKILPQVEYPVIHGDVISLGRLKVQVLIRGEEGKA